MIKNMKREQIAAILDAMPFEMTFVDENDLVQYANKIETRILQFNKDEVAGRYVGSCMSAKTQPKMEKILADFKSGKADEAEFWIRIPSLTGAGMWLDRFIALHDKTGKYLGVLQYILNFQTIEQIAEDKKDAPVFEFGAP